jgi:hypothetical protein
MEGGGAQVEAVAAIQKVCVSFGGYLWCKASSVRM